MNMFHKGSHSFICYLYTSMQLWILPLRIRTHNVRLFHWNHKCFQVSKSRVQSCAQRTSCSIQCTDCFVYADIWSRYISVFGGLWAATAFKGATGPCAVATDIGYHIENHKQWISVVSADIRPLTDKFHGYALTGWQRSLVMNITSSLFLD